MARRASLTLRKRRLSTRFDAGSLNSHLPRESVSSVNYGDERIGKAHETDNFILTCKENLSKLDA